MMNIMIVDDEVEIREGLRCLIGSMPGAGADFEVISVCEGAEEALEALSRQFVDVMITDIRMARVDGLRLTETAKSLYPTLKVVILSGYSDFNYAQRAIQLDASDYLLKPVKKGELEAVLCKLHEQCAQLKEAKLFLDTDEFERRRSAYAAIMTVDDNAASFHPDGAPDSELPSAVKEAVHGLTGTYMLKGFITRTNGNRVIGVCGESAEVTERVIAAVCERLQAYGRRPGRSASVGISEIAVVGQPVHSLYLHACTAISNRLLQGAGIWAYTPRSFDESLFQVDLSRIEAAWETLDFPAIYEEIGFTVAAAMRKRDIALLIWTINTIMLTLNDKVKKFNHLNESIPYDISGFLFKVLWCRSADDLHEYLLKRVKELLSEISPERREGQIVSRAKQYIQQHLHEQISLSDISREVCVSVSYLSRMFREKTGVTFLEYLTGKRVESAKELLAQPGVKVYEVAEQVGYGSWKHFSRTFKEVTGHTPADYKQNVCNP